jgi:DNA-directed RNA polymerase specialized sigma24 family protein
MRPQAHAADDHPSCHLSLITCRYLRYILIRTLAYTNDRAVAERIAVYTLITTCLLSRRLGRMADLGLVIETMVGIVGDDQVISDKGHVISDELETENSTLNTADARICGVAGAINAIDRFERELLILNHVEGISPAALAEIHEMPVARIEKALAGAEHELVEILRGLSSWDHEIEPDVHSILNDLAGCLDEECARDVADCARQYLAGHRPWP